jgi:hypothetical protein
MRETPEMLLQRPLLLVLLITVVTIVAQCVWALIGQDMLYAGRAMNPSTETVTAWAIFGAGIAAVVATLGPRHQQLIPLALLFLVAAVFGTLVAGPMVLHVFRGE